MTVTIGSTRVRGGFSGIAVFRDTKVPDYTQTEVRTGHVTDRELIKTRVCW